MNDHSIVRRNRVDERLATAIAIGGGLVGLASPAAPTGATITDAIVIFAAIAAVIWASASAPWWAIAAMSGVAGAIAFSPIVAVVGFLGFLAGLHVGLFRRDDSEIRALIGAVAVNALLWSQLEGFFGLSSLIGIVVGVGVFALGVRRRPSRVRTPAWRVAGALGVVVVAATIGAAIAATNSRGDLTDAASTARSAVAMLDSGDYEASAARFEQAAAGFERGSGQLGGLTAAPARLIPALAQNLAAGRVLSDVAADAMAQAASALRRIDPDQLRLQSGNIDLAAVAAVEQPLLDVQSALVALEAGTERVQSPWLIDSLQRQIDDLEDDVGKNAPRLANSIDAVRIAPALLGGNGERTYLLLFTSPSEARGAAGFFGNWAELTANDGRLTVDRFGRTTKLNEELQLRGSDCDGCSEEFLNYYGQYGFTTGDGGSVGDVAWSNVTMPAHFPYAASAIASLYPDSGGRELDGVIALDPYVLAQLMAYTGPIDVAQYDVTVTADTAVEFLIADQYELANGDDRVDALDTLGREAIRRFLLSSLPDPPTLAAAFGPLVEESRLLMWTTDASERSFLERIGMLGALPTIDSVDGGFGVGVVNATANKIDSFLERSVTVTSHDAAGAGRSLVGDVTLTNTAPASGLSDYVIGNPIGLPRGTSRLIVTFYGPPIIESITLDGDEIVTATLTEAGWFGFRTVIELGAGETATFRVAFAIPDDDDSEFDPTIWEQPLRR